MQYSRTETATARLMRDLVELRANVLASYRTEVGVAVSSTGGAGGTVDILLTNPMPTAERRGPRPGDHDIQAQIQALLGNHRILGVSTSELPPGRARGSGWQLTIPSIRIDANGKASLQVREHTTATGEEGTCAICVCDTSRGQTLTITKCKHVFHRECVDSWLNKKNTCPMCREKAF